MIMMVYSICTLFWKVRYDECGRSGTIGDVVKGLLSVHLVEPLFPKRGLVGFIYLPKLIK